MIIDSIGWNVDAVQKMTREQFIKDAQHHALYWRITDPAERTKALNNAYDLITNSGGKPNPAGEDIPEEQE
jgi:hypothetical protein